MRHYSKRLPSTEINKQICGTIRKGCRVCDVKRVWCGACVMWSCVMWSVCDVKRVWCEAVWCEASVMWSCVMWSVCDVKRVWCEACVMWTWLYRCCPARKLTSTICGTIRKGCRACVRVWNDFECFWCTEFLEINSLWSVAALLQLLQRINQLAMLGILNLPSLKHEGGK